MLIFSESDIMDLNWEHLVEKGWIKEEIIQNGKNKTTFKTPVENGIRRTIRRSKDLKKHEEKFIHILFPHSDLAKKRAVVNLQMEVENHDSPSSLIVVPSKVTKVEMEKEKLEESASRLYPNNQGNTDDLGNQIQEYVNFISV